VVASATPRGARRGDPLLGAVRIIDARTGRSVARPSGSATRYASGLAVGGTRLWTAGTVHGTLTRVPL
jgi:hypothetical protein